MNKIIILVHGFANPNGINTTDRLRPYFEKAGYEAWEWDYGWKGLLGVRLCNKAVAYGLMRFAKFAAARDQKVYAVGHSNGCELIRIATQAWEKPDGHSFPGASFEQVALIDPALDRCAEFGPAVKKIHVYYTPTDWVVRAARFLPLNPWGDMGAVGYKGNDLRFRNHKFSARSLTAHNDFFNSEVIEAGAAGIMKEFDS